MSYKIMFILNAVVVLALGLGLLIFPSLMLGQFGTETRVAELQLARFIGAALVSAGLLFWFAKDAAEEAVQKNLGMAGLIGSVLALIVTVIGVSPLSGIIRTNGWLAIVVEVLFGLGYGFMLFLQPRMK